MSNYKLDFMKVLLLLALIFSIAFVSRQELKEI